MAMEWQFDIPWSIIVVSGVITDVTAEGEVSRL